MKLLLDTHVLLWWLQRDDRLPAAFAELLAEVSPEAPAPRS